MEAEGTSCLEREGGGGCQQADLANKILLEPLFTLGLVYIFESREFCSAKFKYYSFNRHLIIQVVFGT